MNHRRKLLAALGAGAFVNALAAHAQQAPARPRRLLIRADRVIE